MQEDAAHKEEKDKLVETNLELTQCCISSQDAGKASSQPCLVGSAVKRRGRCEKEQG